MAPARPASAAARRRAGRETPRGWPRTRARARVPPGPAPRCGGVWGGGAEWGRPPRRHRRRHVSGRRGREASPPPAASPRRRMARARRPPARAPTRPTARGERDPPPGSAAVAPIPAGPALQPEPVVAQLLRAPARAVALGQVGHAPQLGRRPAVARAAELGRARTLEGFRVARGGEDEQKPEPDVTDGPRRAVSQHCSAPPARL